MAKYDIKELKELLDGDEYDVLVPEFLARATNRIGLTGQTVHRNRTQTVKLAIKSRKKLTKASIALTDDLAKSITKSDCKALDAQSDMVKATARMMNALATVTERITP